MDDTAIMLKGTSEGILLRPKSPDWDTVLTALEQALLEAEAFFRGGRLILEVGERELTQTQLTSVRTLVSQFDIQLWAVLSENDKTVHLARSNSILTRLPKDTEPRKPMVEVPPEQRALMVQQTLRSGQSIRYPGNITLVGDVNPGAEIVAGGSIIVWGAIRGVAHAGAFGDEESVICALELQPSQLRIAGHIGRPPEQRRRTPVPEIARVEDDHIVAEAWTRKR
ncbi:MAG: septum site-determining protein MinC [Anaerolineae bacterium]|jgi:septum site-determining protein MinC|nr:septum site-determining protein MinC [Anaerolineae bacterium]